MEINKQKLLDYIEGVINLYRGDLVLEVVRKHIQSGAFDSPSTQEEIAKLKEELRTAKYEDCRHAKDPGLYCRTCHVKELQEANKLLEAERDEILRQRDIWKKHQIKQFGRAIKAEKERDLQRERGDKFYDLFLRLEKDINEFGRLVGIELDDTSLEEKAAAYNTKVRELEKERDIAVIALEWYSDAAHYESKPSDDDFAEWEVPDAVDDRGDRARTAIDKIRRNTDAPKDTNGLS